MARTVLRIRPWRVQRTAPRFLSALGCAGGSGHEPPGYPLPGASAGPRRVSAPGHHPHERGRGRPPLQQPCCGRLGRQVAPTAPRRSRGWGRLDSSRAVCTELFCFYPVGGSWHELPGYPLPGAPKQRAAPAHLAASRALGCAGGVGHELRGILPRGASAGPFRVSALSCRLHERGRG